MTDNKHDKLDDTDFELVTCSSIFEQSQNKPDLDHIPGGEVNHHAYESRISLIFPQIDEGHEPPIAIKMIPRRNENGDIIEDTKPVFRKK